MADLTVKQSDGPIDIVSTLSDQVGPVDLSGAAVRFLMRSQKTKIVKVNATATPDPDQVGNAGRVKYALTPTDLNEAGIFIAEWEVTFSGGKKVTFPSAGYNVINILEELG